MTEYVNADSQKSANLAKQANSEFENGISMRETGDKYVKGTVFLATVLLLTALAQRFEIFGPRGRSGGGGIRFAFHECVLDLVFAAGLDKGRYRSLDIRTCRQHLLVSSSQQQRRSV
jgi:hypothetical protein